MLDRGTIGTLGTLRNDVHDTDVLYDGLCALVAASDRTLHCPVCYEMAGIVAQE